MNEVQIGWDGILRKPLLNQAGFLGFSPSAKQAFLKDFGAFITNPISRRARHSAADRCVVPFSGGCLFHTGHPNPGIKAIIKDHAKAWQRSTLPIWVHILAENPEMIAEMVQMLENCENVTAIELGIDPDIHSDQVLDMINAALGELPLVIDLPLSHAGESWVKKLPDLGIQAISLSGPRGALPVGARLVEGRLFGHALFPLALKAIKRVLPLGLTVIAGCGVYTQKQVDQTLMAGAKAVKLDAVLWQGGLSGTSDNEDPDQP